MALPLLFALLLLFNSGDCSKLNVPRVLLSYNYEVPSNFTLKVIEGGCYSWRSTRGNEVLVQPVVGDDGCATEAVVSAVTRSPARQTAIILASDVASGVTLRCDVIIDSFSRLEIVTTTRELYVEEAPEEFEVRAYDDQGNEFSSLDGLKFNWQLENVAGQQRSVPAHSILRFMRFSESPYKTPAVIGALEQQGHQGSQVLVEGKQTGIARLKASISHPAYNSMPPATVILMVVANLLLEPQDVYVLPNTPVVYTVFHLKQGILHPVPLKPSHYYLQVEDNNIGELQDDGVTVVSQDIGQTKVVLEDSNVKASGSIKQPSANYHVVEPGYLIIEIEPGNKPSLIVDKPSAFHVHLHDDNNNRVFLSDNLVINTVVPREYFFSEEVRPNGTFVAGLPRKEGKMTVTATLSEYILKGKVVPISPPLKATVDVQIFAPLVVSPKYTLLPWDEITKPQHSLQLYTEGGSGHVVWHSNASDIGSINKLGLVSTAKLGEVLITASMAENHANHDTALVIIKEIMGLSLVEGYREFVIDETLVLGIAALSSPVDSTSVFSSCEMLRYRVVVVNPDFSALSKIRSKELEGSCASLDLISDSPGFSEVKVSYTTTEKDNLLVSATVGAFKPLVVTLPKSGDLVLALGTGYSIHFEGGPLPWIHKPSGHYARFNTDDNDLVRSHLDGSGRTSGKYSIYVECLQLGETKVTLTVGNTASVTLPQPKESTATASVVCAHPETLQLGVVGADVLPCPLHQHASAVASCHSVVPLSVIVRDAHGDKLDNISSLSFTWSSEQDDLASLPDDGFLQTDASGIAYGALVPRGVAGELTVSVTMIERSISSSLLLRLVPPPSLRPEHLVLHHHLSSTGDLRVVGGSGYFELLPHESKLKSHSFESSFNLSKDYDAVAQVSYHALNTSVFVSAKGLGSRLVSIRDLCLPDLTDAPSAVVTVTSPSSVVLVVPPMVEKGNSVEAVLQLVSGEGYIVPILPNLMQFSVIPKEDLVSLKYTRLSQDGGAVYEVTGLAIGDTSLRGTVHDISDTSSTSRTQGQRLVSSYEPIHVFPPLRLRPRYVTLVVGAKYQVRASGGPSSSVLRYHSSNSSVCGVKATSGVVTAAMVGNSTITVSAKLPSSFMAGDHVMLCRDVVFIRVVTLSSIELVAPTSHLEAGTAMPVHVLGRSLNVSESHENGLHLPPALELTPLSFASAEPPLLFRWSNSDNEVAQLDHILAGNDIESSSVNSAAMVLRTKAPGVTVISVSVSVLHPASSLLTAQILGDVTLTATFTLTVFQPLSLLAPPADSARLLLSPGSHFKLKTNRDSESIVAFQNTSPCSVKSKDSSNYSTNGRIVTLKKNIVEAGNTTGVATVLVSAKESCGVVQHASLLVEVLEVCYVLATASPVLASADHKLKSTNLPVGAVLPFEISYHDCTGRPFDAISQTDLKVVSNREDLILHKSGHTQHVELRVRGSGQTVLAVTLMSSEDNQLLQHFFRVPTGFAVVPHQSCVAVGQPVCLKASVVSDSGEVGSWGGADGVEVSSESGVALSLATGTAKVVYAFLSKGMQQTLTGEFAVRPITELVLVAPGDALSDGVEGDVITTDISLQSADCTESTSAACWPAALPSVSLLQHLSCELHLQPPAPAGARISQVFHTTATYTEGRGYGCSVQTASEHSSWLRDHLGQHSDLSISLSAALTSVGPSQPALRSGAITLSFVPGVVVNGSTSVTLSASSLSDSTMLTGPLAALSQLSMKSNSTSVSVRLEDARESGATWERLVVVEATGGKMESEGTVAVVTVTSPLTRQTFDIQVGLESSLENVCPAPQQPVLQLVLATLNRYHTHLFAVLCVVLTAAAAAVGYQAWCGPGYRNTTAGVFANSPPPPSAPTSPLIDISPFQSRNSSRDIRDISLWSSDSVYGAPPSPPSLLRSPRPLSPL